GSRTGTTALPRWRKFWFGIAAAALIAASTGTFFYLHRARPLTEKDSILLADFSNTTGDAVFDAALKQALAVQLEQSPFLNLVPHERAKEMLPYTSRAPDERATGKLAGGPSHEATTSSLAAFKAFTLGEAERARSSGQFGSVPYYKRAIELDPNFALAYARLGQAYAYAGEEELGRKYTENAYQLRDRVSESEKFYIITHYHDIVTGDQEKAIETYELWRRTYPRDTTPTIHL